jgi:uncharacterized protein YfiM (DUF2279 family)
VQHPIRNYLACLVAICAAVSCQPAHAGGCTAKDKWSGPDKTLHFGGGAAAGFIGALHNDDYWQGVRVSGYVAVGKEALDALGGGTCSLQDALATIAGGMIGAGLGIGVSLLRDKAPDGTARTTLLITRAF